MVLIARGSLLSVFAQRIPLFRAVDKDPLFSERMFLKDHEDSSWL